MTNSLSGAGSATWQGFNDLVEQRRAVRDFSGEVVPEADVRAILGAALLAPSSSNLQPFELHWVRESVMKGRVAAACLGQRAATSASALIVVVARWDTWRDSTGEFLEFVDTSGHFDAKARAHHHEHAKKMRSLFAVGPFGLLAPLRWIGSRIARLFRPIPAVPAGPAGLREWAARNAMLAAQTLMLAARARGHDTCPMEGFDPRRIAKLLDLHHAASVSLVIALGRRTEQARIEPRWRRAFDKLVIVH